MILKTRILLDLIVEKVDLTIILYYLTHQNFYLNAIKWFHSDIISCYDQFYNNFKKIFKKRLYCRIT